MSAADGARREAHPMVASAEEMRVAPDHDGRLSVLARLEALITQAMDITTGEELYTVRFWLREARNGVWNAQREVQALASDRRHGDLRR